MITIATLRKGNNHEQIYYINKYKAYRNTTYNGNNVRFLMTKTLITEELVIITTITVIKLPYRQNSMEENKQTNKQTNLTWLRNWSSKRAYK